MTNKMYDFGVFGKWSKDTLLAQSNYEVYECDYGHSEALDLELPMGIENKNDEINDDFFKISDVKVKKCTIDELYEAFKKIDFYHKAEEDYDRAEEVVMKLIEDKIKKNKKVNKR